MSILAGRDRVGTRIRSCRARGAYLLAFGVAEAGQRVARVVHGGHQRGGRLPARGARSSGGPGLVGGSAGQGPFGVGVGQPPGPQGQVSRIRRRRARGSSRVSVVTRSSA